MRKLPIVLGLFVAAFTFMSIAPAMANPSGMWKRKGNTVVKVSISGGKLYCKIVKGSPNGFEMCHGMVKKGGVWKGGNMKHPSMPGFMTFNGTVRVSGNKLNIKGCAIGQSFCDAETWVRMK